MTTYAERIRRERIMGVNRPLLQSQHNKVNAQFPGLTLEYCTDCGQPTGNAGKGDDSLYHDDVGPFCLDCFDLHEQAVEDE